MKGKIWFEKIRFHQNRESWKLSEANLLLEHITSKKLWKIRFDWSLRCWERIRLSPICEWCCHLLRSSLPPRPVDRTVASTSRTKLMFHEWFPRTNPAPVSTNLILFRFSALVHLGRPLGIVLLDAETHAGGLLAAGGIHLRSGQGTVLRRCGWGVPWRAVNIVRRGKRQRWHPVGTEHNVRIAVDFFGLDWGH